MAEPGVEEPARRRAGRRLVVDARALHQSGIGRYLRAILSHALADASSELVLLGEPAELRAFVESSGSPARVRILPYRGGPYTARAQVAWIRRRLTGSSAGDVYFFPHFDAPLHLPPRRAVVTVHDLTHFKAPELFPTWKRALAAQLLRRVVAGAARVITVSESTRRDLLERHPWAEAKVRVIPNGIEESFRPWIGNDAPRAGWERLPPYLLVVGNRKPNKNLGTLVEALALLRERRPELRLVVAGGELNGDWSAVVRRAGELGVAEAIVDAGAVSDAELRYLYTGCEVFAFPSLYEGFGLPVVEAMACGAPVVASNTSSLPEVVGDAGILVDPSDAAGLAAAVRRLEDPVLRGELVARGRARAAGFSAHECARRTVETLLEIANRV